MGKWLRNWQGIILREWRNCEDEEYEARLFDLVADEPVSGGTTAFIGLLGTLYGAIGGLLVGLLATNWDVWNDPKAWALPGVTLLEFMWKGGVIGGVGALMIRLYFGRRLCWRAWLAWQMSNMALGGLGECLLAALLSGLGGSMLSVIAWPLIDVLLGRMGDALVGGLLGALFGGLGGALHHGANYDGPGGPVLGLSTGLVGGLLGGPIAGLSGMVISGRYDELVGIVVCGLVYGLVSGFGFGLAYEILTILLSEESYPDRSLWFWWRRRSYAVEMEKALQQACAKRPTAAKVWAEPLRRLEKRRGQPSSRGSLMTGLRSNDWVERFTSRHLLVALGGEVVEPLKVQAQDGNSAQRRTAIWLLKSIANDTASRLKRQAPHLLCPRHLVRFSARSVHLSWWTSFTYYGCRACGQSQEFLEWPGEVVAVLDARMAEKQIEQAGRLRVNWLVRQSPFDFDEVEILQATDEEAERFAVQVGNDSDVFRQPRYKKMRCVLAPSCGLSENTVRILERTFGQVESRT